VLGPNPSPTSGFDYWAKKRLGKHIWSGESEGAHGMSIWINFDRMSTWTEE
jgi:hypothetical protein